ncbi:hypothetical protein HK097_002263 [Rhizophlyctis rosea]|uniref:Uncharacterized protein n=1 Tax=Rhizophlyctis rosea TaxID=64517 RepID=A0AAD5S3K0_9FUNG|nr:hypothetical protein HK097_002263 [Rhizophlyctis rosea]
MNQADYWSDAPKDATGYPNQKWVYDVPLHMPVGATRPEEISFGFWRITHWAVVGFGIRSMALGLQHLPLLYKPARSLAMSGAFVGMGYGHFLWQKDRLTKLERLRDKLTKRRMLRRLKEAPRALGELPKAAAGIGHPFV